MKFKFVWEQRKLGEVIERKTQKRESSDLPYIEYADIIPNIGRLNKDIFSRKNTKQGVYFQKNDILFGKLRPYLNNWLKPQFEGIAVGDFWILNGIKLDNDFLYYYIQTKKFSDVANVTTGTKMPRSDWKLVSNLKIKFPNFEEQQNIGKLLYSLEKLITLYENKRKLLTALFQGLSQYLFNFSKEKNAIQMSLSSITVSETKGIAKENTLSLGNIEYLDTTRLNGGKAKLVSGKKDVDFRDIIILWDGSNAGKIYYGFSGILGSTLKVFKLKDDINSEYVYYYLKFKQNLILHKFRTPNIPHVSKDFSQRFNLPIPDKEKQNLIANILHLNELQINLINKKIEKLKQIKKSLLQNMFL